MEAKKLLDVKALSIGFHTPKGAQTAVYEAGFNIALGETIGLVGESGSGKSVCALSILRLLPYPSAFHRRGRILFEGENLLEASPDQLRAVRGNDIAMIFQEPMTSLNPLHTIEKQIGEVLEVHQGLRGADITKEVLRLLERVGIAQAQKRLNALPHELSGGQRQRVMIAMALANKPKLLIADEPTTALDVTVQKQVLDLLKELQRETGMALLLITHDLSVVKYMTKRVYVMKDGEIVEHNDTQTLFKKPQHPYTKLLIESEPEGRAADLVKSDILLSAKNIKVWFPVKQDFLYNIKGRIKERIKERIKTRAPKDTKEYIKAVDGASLTLCAGETLGIVGESGSGKTTLGRALLRLQKSEGEIIFDGQQLNGLARAPMRALRKSMQIVFQDPFGALSPRMSVRDIIAEGLRIHEAKLSAAEIDARVIEALSDVGLSAKMGTRYPHEFSGGQRQRIAIARAIILNPRLLILDEPTSALDRSVQAQIVSLLRKLQLQKNLSYIFISHDLKVVRALAHRVMVMKEGRVVEQGTVADIFDTPKTDYTRNLIGAAFDLNK